MYHSLLTDARFHNSLFDLDRLIAEQVRQDQCPLCRGNLNQAHFPRKPRGVPEGTHSDYPIRFSYCCGTEDCRYIGVCLKSCQCLCLPSFRRRANNH